MKLTDAGKTVRKMFLNGNDELSDKKINELLKRARGSVRKLKQTLMITEIEVNALESIRRKRK